jgi:hypothetical protein
MGHTGTNKYPSGTVPNIKHYVHMNQLSPQKINELLAAKAGWNFIVNAHGHTDIIPLDMDLLDYVNHKGAKPQIPDYYNDLNAIHILEEFLLDDNIDDVNSLRYSYSYIVYRMCPPNIQPFRVPASIRAMALVELFYPDDSK